jgi:hypothetical protein
LKSAVQPEIVLHAAGCEEELGVTVTELDPAVTLATRVECMLSLYMPNPARWK